MSSQYNVHNMNNIVRSPYERQLNYLAITTIPEKIRQTPIQYDQVNLSPNIKVAATGTITMANAENGYANGKGILCRI